MNTLVSRRHLMIGAVASCSTIALAPARAKPAREPTTFVVASTPGGSIDIAVRILAEDMAKDGWPTVVENRPGGSSIIGAQYAARRPPDGFTVFAGSNSSLVNNVGLFEKLPYDPAKDFLPVGMLGQSSLLLSARQGAPFKTAREMVAFASGRPKRVSRGSSGIGNITNIGMLRFERRQSLEMVHAPYTGEAQSLLALLNGEIDLQVGSVSSKVVEFAQQGKLTPIAVMGPKRHPYIPNVPTIAEAGFPDSDCVAWFALTVPAGTSPQAIARLNATLNQALKSSSNRERILKAGIEPLGGSANGAAEFIDGERNRWIPFLRASGIKT